MSTAPALDARGHLIVAKALIKAEIGANNVYGFGEVPGSNGNTGTLPNIYVIASVERRSVPVTRMAARASRSSWRLSLRWVGRTEAEARWAEARVALALDGATIAVDDETSTPLLFESSAAAEYDEGRMSGLSRFIYTL